MRLSRLFVSFQLEPGDTARLGPRQAHYVARVLRLRALDPVVLFNGDGFDYSAVITHVDRDQVRVQIETRLPLTNESPLSVTLVQGISRGERMDHSLQKATELGVAAVQPVFSERVTLRLSGSRLERRIQHWQAVVESACEHSGRARVPTVLAPMVLNEWLLLPAAGIRLVLDPAAERSITAMDVKAGEIELVVGPEGGLSPLEIEALLNSGAQAARLGPRTLRTETAGVAALAVLQSIGGDL